MHQNQQLIQYDKILSAFFFINWLFFYHHHFNSWFFSDLTKISSALIFIIDFIQINISTTDFFKIKREFRQHSFLSSTHTDQIWIFFSWNNPPKTTLYEDFWWFSYRRIFPPIFLHGLNFEFYFNSSYQWDE